MVSNKGTQSNYVANIGDFYEFNTFGLVTGWEKTDAEATPAELKGAKIEIKPRDFCQGAYGSKYSLLMICVAGHELCEVSKFFHELIKMTLLQTTDANMEIFQKKNLCRA